MKDITRETYEIEVPEDQAGCDAGEVRIVERWWRPDVERDMATTYTPEQVERLTDPEARCFR